MNTINVKSLEIDQKVEEAIRTVRANIEFLDKESKVIGITSCMGREGKSLIAYQLAVNIAKENKKAVYVNVNLRKEDDLAAYTVDKSEKGLSEYLQGQCKQEEIIHSTTIDNLFMVVAGSRAENPTKLIRSNDFVELIKKLREEFDYVVIDTPAIGEVIDGAIAINVCDGAILVVEPYVVSYELAQKCKKQIEMTSCKILGVVLNKA